MKFTEKERSKVESYLRKITEAAYLQGVEDVSDNLKSKSKRREHLNQWYSRWNPQIGADKIEKVVDDVRDIDIINQDQDLEPQKIRKAALDHIFDDMDPRLEYESRIMITMDFIQKAAEIETSHLRENRRDAEFIQFILNNLNNSIDKLNNRFAEGYIRFDFSRLEHKDQSRR